MSRGYLVVGDRIYGPDDEIPSEAEADEPEPSPTRRTRTRRS